MARTPRGWANRPKDNTGRTITREWVELAYAATIALTALKVNISHYFVAQLTGALTINATTTDFEDLDEVIFYFGTDGTQRIVTFGTKFLSSGTVTIPASKTAIVRGIYDKTLDVIRITGREITA